MRDSRVNERITGLACLSTPFLAAASRAVNPIEETALWWLPVVVVSLGSALLLNYLDLGEVSTGIVLILTIIISVAAGYGSATLLAKFTDSYLNRWITRLYPLKRSLF